MADQPKVKIKIISQKGTCELGHKVGQEYVCEGATPEGMCIWAFQSALLAANAMLFGATFPWEKDPDIAHVACPDPFNPVVMQVIRMK